MIFLSGPFPLLWKALETEDERLLADAYARSKSYLQIHQIINVFPQDIDVIIKNILQFFLFPFFLFLTLSV